MIDLIITIFRGSQISHVNLQSLIGIGTNMKGGGTKGTVEQGPAIELGSVGNPGQLLLQLGNFITDLLTICCRIGAISALYCQFANTLQDVGHFLQCAFTGLRQ